jgi:hypothetical protein
MRADILCTLLAKRILPEKFQLQGLEIHWMDETFDTPENQAITADVIQNYDTLAAEYQAGIDAEIAAKEAEQLLKAQAYIDNLPDWETVKKAIDAAFIDAKQNSIITKLARVVYWDVKNTEL